MFCAFVGMSSDSSAATIGLSDIAPMVKVTYIPMMIGIIILLFMVILGSQSINEGVFGFPIRRYIPVFLTRQFCD